jgi:hypothetical protein
MTGQRAIPAAKWLFVILTTKGSADDGVSSFLKRGGEHFGVLR